MKDVCMDDSPSSLKKWKNKFFLIDCRAILEHQTWRHSCSSVSDDLPSNGYDRNDVQRLCACLIRLYEMREEVLVHSGLSYVWFNKECDPVFRRDDIYDFMTLPSWSDAKIAEESHYLSLSLLERVSSHTIASATEGAIIPLPTSDEEAAKKDLEAGSSALELDQAEGTDKSDLANLCAKIKDSLKRDKGVSMRAILAPTPRLGKRLGDPPSLAVVSASEPSYVETLAPASTSGRSLSLGGVVASGYVGKSKVEVMQNQMDLLDCLARSALACDAEYDLIMDDDLAPLLVNRPHALERSILCKDIFKDSHVCRKALDQTITPAELRRNESLHPLELSNHVNLLSALLVSHGYELNSRYANLVSSKAHLQDKLDKKKKGWRIGSYNELALEKSKSQGYKDAMDGLREEVTQFVGSGVESLVRKLLSSNEFHAALALVASLGINYDVKRGLRMGRTNVEFKVAVQKVSNFHAGAKADFGKALVDFPTCVFLFLARLLWRLNVLFLILPKKFVRSATSVFIAPSSVNEALEQVPP
nr:hypothetical protein [Tanacetum cinerariifolium]